MRALLLGFLGLIGLFTLAPAAAEASRCGLIRRSDGRNFCYARSNRSTSRCGLIRKSDIRNYCYATVGRRRSYCGLIRKSDLPIAPRESDHSGGQRHVRRPSPQRWG